MLNYIYYIAPFAVWMVMMTILPATAGAYALRGFATAALLIASGYAAGKKFFPRVRFSSLLVGLIGGVAVCVIWILPESSSFYKTWLCWPPGSMPPPTLEPSPYDPAVCGWWLTVIKLIASAFIIAPVEEIFFRSFLYRRLQSRDFESVSLSKFDASSFAWMVCLFAAEHDRYLVAAIAGAVYGLLAIRFSLSAAVIAHVVTNLLLALYVIYTGNWGFW
jgi:CAAX prenyl protease-like protein